MDSPRILCLGGVDPSGGAGLVADARMIQARGGVPLAVPVCLTAQNRAGVRAVRPVELDLVDAMLAAAVEDGPVHAVKTGLLGAAGAVRRVAAGLRRLCSGVPVVVDPVLSATAGGWRAADDLVDAYRVDLAPLAAVLTPNLPEVARLGIGPRALLEAGCGAVLVKGGHAEGPVVEDRLWTAAGEAVFRHPRLEVGEVRGTGCALAAALACGLGRGLGVEEACRQAIEVLGRCLAATPPGEDGRPVTLVVT